MLIIRLPFIKVRALLKYRPQLVSVRHTLRNVAVISFIKRIHSLRTLLYHFLILPIFYSFLMILVILIILIVLFDSSLFLELVLFILVGESVSRGLFIVVIVEEVM